MAQYRAFVAVLEVRPYAALRRARVQESSGVGPGVGAAREGGEEAGAEEDGEDAEVLERVSDADGVVSRAERILHARAEFVRQHSFWWRMVRVNASVRTTVTEDGMLARTENAEVPVWTHLVVWTQLVLLLGAQTCFCSLTSTLEISLKPERSYLHHG